MLFNKIEIRPTPRGYRVQLPYKPVPNAIRGLHSIGMVWQKYESGVVWSIPADRLSEAQEFIAYWYGEKAGPGRTPCTVEVIKEVEQEAA